MSGKQLVHSETMCQLLELSQTELHFNGPKRGRIPCSADGRSGD